MRGWRSREHRKQAILLCVPSLVGGDSLGFGAVFGPDWLSALPGQRKTVSFLGRLDTGYSMYPHFHGLRVTPRAS
jgi:hypothetical protein